MARIMRREEEPRMDADKGGGFEQKDAKAGTGGRGIGENDECWAKNDELGETADGLRRMPLRAKGHTSKREIKSGAGSPGFEL